MTAQVRRYGAAGPSEASINAVLPGGATVSGISVSPASVCDVPLSDDAAAQDLDDVMLTIGWEFGGETNPTASAAKSIKQIVTQALAGDASQISVPALQTESAWVDVVSRTLDTRGGTSVGVLVAAVGSAGVGEGRARLVVDGGEFSSQVLGADYHAIALLTRGTVSFHCPVPIPATQSSTTYTFKLQMQATGVLGALTPRKGCVVTCTEHM